MDFRFWLLRLQFEALGPIRFPRAMAANVFRGALGTRLPSRIFSPAQGKNGPSGLAELPRPFVIRARPLDAQSFSPGDVFAVDIHLFAPIAPQIAEAFQEVRPLHGGARLIDDSIFEERITVPLSPDPHEPGEAKILFVSPTELKYEDAIATRPEFPILFARAVSRLRTLASLYAEPLDLDFARLAALSARVRIERCQLAEQRAQRRSSRTGLTHPLSGFTGNVRYRGEMSPLLPILRAAQFTGVGRQTVWGKGQIELAP